MDWNKTKTLFIVVFSILNIFLYYLYLDRYTEAENAKFLGSELSVDEKLKADQITYPALPEEDQYEPYINASMKTFTKSDVPGGNQKVDIAGDRFLTVSYPKPLPIEDIKSEKLLEEFVADHAYQGGDYALWEINAEENKAVFFQIVNGKTLYYSDNAQVTLYWNDKGEVTHYEQTIFENVQLGEQPKKLIPAISAISTLYQRGILPSNTQIDSAEIGYTVYVQVSEDDRMFLPTWHISATLADGSKEEYFINAVKDGVIELQKDEEETEAPQ
ncbi:two-component system regulatory protein YycI [Planococcus sp. YIM B11945]|uniref:two-component system regulatory protein YycI n=1 Tax=Planococcus sp. YIM B11945 TaxID=3435410 RepID=UPI003D7D27C1